MTVSAIVVVALSDPEVPLIVIVEVPAVAETATVKVTTLVVVAGFVPKAAVTPVGKPVAANVTLPANGLTSVIVMVSVPLAPCAIESEVAEGFSVKLPVAAAFTVKAIVVDAVKLPLVPVIVTVEVPTVAVALAANVTTLLPVVGFVPKVAVTPLGKPVAANVTLPAKGAVSATVMVSVALAPCVTASVAAEGVSLKLPVATPPQVTPLSANDVGIALVTLFHVPLKPMPE